MVFSKNNLILIIHFCLPSILALSCYPPPERVLPIPAHCRDLATAILYASFKPLGNDPKSWGRGLPTTPDTERLPKLYWLVDRPYGPSTCALLVDTIPLDPFAVETFRLRTVGIAAERIIGTCLMGRSQVGSEPMGKTKGVEASLIRHDGSSFLGTEAPRVEVVFGQNNGSLLSTTRNTTAGRSWTTASVAIDTA